MRIGRDDWLSSVPIAHRGLHDRDLPENSLPAFEAAARCGYGIELDVHLTRDRRLAVIHDYDTLRATGHRLTVAECASSQLQELKLVGTDLQIPLLDEVLDAVHGRVPLLIEVKPGSPAHHVGPVLVAMLDRYTGPAAVQSFDPRLIVWLRRRAPRVLRGQLSSSHLQENLSLRRTLMARNMLINAISRPNFIALDVESMPNRSALAWKTVLRAPLLLWTVSGPQHDEVARRYRANVIFEKIRPPGAVLEPTLDR